MTDTCVRPTQLRSAQSDALFHEGEREAQRKAGTTGVANELSRAIKKGGVHPDILPFLYACQMIGVSTFDRTTNEVWASSFYVPDGLITVDRTYSVVHLTIPRQNLVQGGAEGETNRGPLLGYGLPVRIKEGDYLSLLPFEPSTRSRYRINGEVGQVTWTHESLLVSINVVTALYNCPKYINRRAVEDEELASNQAATGFKVDRSTGLSNEQRSLISQADMLFMATCSPEHGADVNHRGGRPGFVRVLEDGDKTVLMWPEYRGNGMLQSTGNICLNPRIGLVFVDFSSAMPSHLHLTGSAQVDWNDSHGFEGGDRVIIFTLETAVQVNVETPKQSSSADSLNVAKPAFPHFKLYDYSPYNPKISTTTTMEDTGSLFPIEVKLVRIVPESPVIKTFRFTAAKKLAWKPGQYASFSFDADLIGSKAEGDKVIRTWTISETPNSVKGDFSIEISVKRKEGGLVSEWLHRLTSTDEVTATLLGIDGDFTPFPSIEENEKEKEEERRKEKEEEKLGWQHPPAGLPPSRMLFLSAGVGITPLMAMLRGVRAAALDEEPQITFLHSERYLQDIPFGNELKRRAKTDANLRLVLFRTGKEEPTGEEKKKIEEQWREEGGGSKVRIHSGRMDKQALMEIIEDKRGFMPAFICGPSMYIESMKELLLELNYPPELIHAEHFYF